MSKSIQVRDVPETTHRELRTRAAAAGVSLSQYVLAELERVAARPSIADVLQRAGRRPIAVEHDTVVSAVRSARDRD